MYFCNVIIDKKISQIVGFLVGDYFENIWWYSFNENVILTTALLIGITRFNVLELSEMYSKTYLIWRFVKFNKIRDCDDGSGDVCCINKLPLLFVCIAPNSSYTRNWACWSDWGVRLLIRVLCRQRQTLSHADASHDLSNSYFQELLCSISLHAGCGTPSDWMTCARYYA